MATFNKFNVFATDLGKGVHNLHTHTLKVYLSNSAPSGSGHTIKANIPEITAGNGYTAGGVDIQNTFSAGQMAAVNVTITATGPVGPFRYVILYNDDSPSDSLIGWWDGGSSLTLAAQDTFTVNFASPLLTIA